MTEVLRALYASFNGTPFGDALSRMWSGAAVGEPALARLRASVGEVQAWGGPHLTLLDALTTTEPDQFDAEVRSCCAAHGPVELSAVELARWGAPLVVVVHSPDLERLRDDLRTRTRRFIHRIPLSDELLRLALWRTRRGSADEAAVRAAWRRYLAAGSPALPSSRHFGIARLVALSRAVDEAPNDAAKSSAERALQRFFESGVPWYGVPGGMHVSLASGLPVDGKSGGPSPSDWEAIRSWALRNLRSHRVDRLFLMTEDPSAEVDLNVLDWLTNTYVKETRPGLTEIDPPILL